MAYNRGFFSYGFGGSGGSPFLASSSLWRGQYPLACGCIPPASALQLHCLLLFWVRFPPAWPLLTLVLAFSIHPDNPQGFPGGSVDKTSAYNARDPGRSPGGGKWQPTPVFFLGKSHGQSSLAGYSPKGHKGLDMTERLSTDNP